jgi:hypothetical protein
MGVICNLDTINERELDRIEVENDDFSFVYSVYSSLYNLNKFKNYILKYKSKSKIYMGKTLKEIFKRNPYIVNEDIRDNNSKKIIYRIIKKENNFGKTAGSITIQILDLLKQEQIERKYPSHSDNFANGDCQIALKEYVEFHRTLYSKNKFSELFHGLLKRQILFNQKILYSFEYFSYIELNLVDIYNKLANEGRIFYNSFNVPEINLIDAIREQFSSRNSKFNNFDSIEQKSLFCTAPYLIFILNSQKSFQNQIYNYFNFGKFVYGLEIDISCLVEYSENKKIYKISSIIKEKSVNNNINNNNINFNSNNIITNNNDDNDDHCKYINSNVDEYGQFYYYKNNNKISGIFNKPGYYDHVLIYKQLKE